MLILSRRLGESIVIGEDIKVTILGVTGNQIRIGIDAPKSIEVHREEIYNKIHGGENKIHSKPANKSRALRAIPGSGSKSNLTGS